MFKYFLHHMFETPKIFKCSLILFRCTGNPPVLSRFTRSYGRIWWLEIPGYWPCVSIAAWVQADLEWKFDAQGKSRVIFFNFAVAIASTTKNWVLFFLQYRGNDLLIFLDAKAKEEAQREKKLASLCRYPSHSSWWKSDVHCLFVFYIHPLRTINKPLPNLLYKESNDTSAKNTFLFSSIWSYKDMIHK